MTTATDELRKLLMERGVEWRSKDEELGLNIDGFHDTRWQVNGVLWCFIESGDNTCLAMCGDWKGCTPEQAIAATLGSVTCENVNTDGYGFYFECSECGYSTIVHNCAVRLDELPKFCPECGCKVRKAVVE